MEENRVYQVECDNKSMNKYFDSLGEAVDYFDSIIYEQTSIYNICLDDFEVVNEINLNMFTDDDAVQLISMIRVSDTKFEDVEN